MVHLRAQTQPAAPVAPVQVPYGPVGQPALPAPAAMSVTPRCPVIEGRPQVPGYAAPAYPVTGPQPACTHVGPSSKPATGTSTKASSMTASYAIAGTLGAVLLGAVGIKYRTHSHQTSFWGRILGLALAAGCAYQASSAYSLYTENNCSSADSSSSTEGSEACPSSTDVIGLGVMVAFHLLLNLPFIFSSKTREKKLYAQFSLYQQATVTTGFCGATAVAMHSLGGGIIAKALAGAGCMVGGMFTMGYFKNEDGAMERLLENASALAGKVGETAAAALDSGLQLFGLDASERSKVSEANVYLHARVKVVRETADAEGEVVGFTTAKGSEGRAPRRGRGYANVELDGGKGVQEFAIGGETGRKFELQFEDEGDQTGVVDKVMANMFSVFGFNDDHEADSKFDRKRQIECFFQQLRPSAASRADDEDSPAGGEGEGPRQSFVHLTLEAFDEDLNVKATVGDGGQMGASKTAFKGAARFKEVGKGVSAVVVELQKLPDDVQFLAFSVRMEPGKKLRQGALTALGASLRGFGKVVSEVGELGQKFEKNGANEGFMLYVVSKKKVKGEIDPVWIAVDKYQTAFTPAGGSEAVASFVSKVKEKRDKDKSFVSENVNVIAKLVELEIQYIAEQKAKVKIAEDIDNLATKFTEMFIKQGKPPAAARVIAKKYAAVQFQKVQGARYQQILRARLPLYVRAGKQPQLALQLAKADALKAITFGSRGQALLSEARDQVLAEEDKIKDLKIKEKEAYKNSWAGFASGMLWGDSDQDEKKKKRKKNNSTTN